MDIFKLLTRSSKLSKSAKSSAGHPDSSLPSAGQTPNPQIHAQVEKRPTLGKRKRIQSGVEEIPAEVDFFATASASRRNVEFDSPAEPTSATINEDEQGEQDADGWQRVLKAHKVKISILKGVEVEQDLEDNSSSRQRKARKRKNSVEERKVNQKAPLAITRPLQSFLQLHERYGVGKRVVQNIARDGYVAPTEIQLAALPLLMGESLLLPHADDSDKTINSQGNVDLLAVAPTGSGKTLAFLIPILKRLMDDNGENKTVRRSGPRALVIVPTKELAAQVVNEGRKLAVNTAIKVTLIKKGMNVGSDEEVMVNESVSEETDTETGEELHEEDDIVKSTVVTSDIIVATPLALVHALKRKKNTRALLPSVQFLVLDEADILLDQLFQEQTLSIWESCINESLRTSLWSATMASSIEQLALSTIQSRTTDSASQSTIIRLVVGLKDTAISTVTHTLTYAATEAGKLMALRQLIRPSTLTESEKRRDTDTAAFSKELRPPFLVFTQTIPRAIALHSELRYDIPPEAGGSSRIAVLHAGLSDTARSTVMARFRKGELWIIITTDLLARGIDFRGLNGVVNYDVPSSAAAYVHRAGRTGRAGRIGGVVVTLYSKEDIAHIKPIVNIIAASEKADGSDSSTGVQQWLLDALPDPSKRDKKKLKQRGVEERRAGIKSAQISTKPPNRHSHGKHKPKKNVRETDTGGFNGFED